MPLIQIRPKQEIIAIDGWRDYRLHGQQFLQTAEKALNRGDGRFSAEAIYNIMAMAVEKLCMAFLLYHQDLAENHTMADLLDALRRHVPVPENLARDILYLGSFQEICDLDVQHRQQPTTSELQRICATAGQLSSFVQLHLSR